jgi:hypothetical protein
MSVTKRLTVLLATGALVTMAIGVVGSAAWFTDSAVLPVSAAAGQIDFKLGGTNSGSITLTNLQPGVWSDPYEVNVYNQDPSTTMPVKYRFLDHYLTDSVAGFYNQIAVTVRHTNCGTANPAGWPVVYQGFLKDLEVASPTTPGIISPSLGVNITHCFYLQFGLDSSTGNAYQGAQATFQIDYQATQVENPGWTE